MSDRAAPVLLADPSRYALELERLGARARARGALDRMRQWDATLGELWVVRDQLCRKLARTVAAGEYRLGPVEARRVRLSDKARTLHTFGFIDQTVVATLARGLSSLAEPDLSDGLYSYRKGRSAALAIQRFCAHLAAHRAARPRIERGLYVLRRDVEAFGESIPTGPESALWPALARVTARMTPAERPVADALLAQAVRPEVRSDAGAPCTMTRGTPTGSPLQPLVNNLYLAELDRALFAIESGFYARFGDDLLFAHADPAVARATSERIAERMADLGLRLRADKRADLYFTHCGRPSEGWPEARGTSSLEYLGFRIGFDGRVTLKPGRIRSLMRDLRARWHNTLAATAACTTTQCLPILCQVTNRALDGGNLLSTAAAESLLHAVNDRGQLKQLDYAIALELAQLVSGRRGVRAFRRVRYRSLRQAGLRSLVVARNRHRAPRPERLQ